MILEQSFQGLNGYLIYARDREVLVFTGAQVVYLTFIHRDCFYQ